MPRSVTRVDFPGPAGNIHGLLHRPEAGPTFRAVASHPHPLFGGTMDNKVIYRVARALEDCGALVLRYDFRGAGRSEGEHDRGAGEQDDLRAAMAFLEGTSRDIGAEALPLLLAGFSFGAVMSARVGARMASIAGLLLVGAPLRSHSFDELLGCRVPVAFVQGERDEHGRLEDVRALAERMSCPVRVVAIEGAGHFFDEEQDRLSAAVRALIASGHFGRLMAEGG